jgi:hypothetical protein
MGDDMNPADGPRMTTVLRIHQRAAGRFGREFRGDQVQMADTRADMDTDGSTTATYTIDADAIAAAIIDRLFAGGALPRPPRAGR